MSLEMRAALLIKELLRDLSTSRNKKLKINTSLQAYTSFYNLSMFSFPQYPISVSRAYWKIATLA